MNQQEHKKLMALLTKLIDAQNLIIRARYETDLLHIDRSTLIARRNEAEDNIVSFVESLTEK